MAFKMNRPLKMKGPLKRAGLNLGRAKNKPADGSGVYYNSNMGPMKMVSPSALKAMEDEMAAGGGMEEMMGMMGDMGGEAPVEEAPVEETPVEEGEGEEKAETIFGQEMVVKEDGTVVIDKEDLGYGIAGMESLKGQDEIVVEDPEGLLDIQDGYVMDDDFTWEIKNGKVFITGVLSAEELDKLELGE